MPIFPPRERAALEIATLFTEDYRAISDEHLLRWKEWFNDKELIELGTFMVFADGLALHPRSSARSGIEDLSQAFS